MQIDLYNTPTAFINLDSDVDKFLKMQELLKNHSNVTRIEAIYFPEPFTLNAITNSHLKAINSFDQTPFVILEDDCVEYNFRRFIDIPDDADIVFLGNFLNESDRVKLFGNIYKFSYIQINNDVVRFFKTSGAHAILVVSETGKKVMTNAYELVSSDNFWQDVSLSHALPFIKAYGFNDPLYYQTSREECSKIVLPTYL